MNAALKILAFFLLACGLALAQATSTQLPSGIVVPKVACADTPDQSYALYLPTQFSPSRKWPIIYVFDPGARGAIAAEVVRAAAEKFGYIVAASNNSRNGPQGRSGAAAQAMWQDTQQRLPVDERRRYFAGLSGGARVASSLAVSCHDCVAGVIANAAAFPPNTQPFRGMKFAYFAAVGDADLNFPEFVSLRKDLEAVGARYRVRIFHGDHGWAPPEVWTEALNWMDLQAMRDGTFTRDQSRTTQAIEEDLGRAREFEAKKDLLSALREYHGVVRDFSGLTDITVAKTRIAELEKDKAVRAQEKQEKAEIEQQIRMVSAPSDQMQAIAAGDLSSSEYMSLRGNLAELKKQAGKESTKGPGALVARRVLGSLMVEAMESGQRSIEQKNYRAAIQYFDLAALVSENSGWAHYERALAYAMSSDKKNALAELRLAMEQGFGGPSSLDAAEFQSYREGPEFRALAAEWSAKKAHP